MVFVLWHEYEQNCGCDETKTIGYFSTYEKAAQAKSNLTSKPGFRDYPDGWEIARCRLDLIGWTDGFCKADA
ncbi:MAG: hypothetical protein COA70_08645 [Planctomycetota bacterium]|nr:MAG: hypothetical protein COA70_08645 [Planctomycetota bacterium]